MGCDRCDFSSSQSLTCQLQHSFGKSLATPIPSMPQMTMASIFSRLDHARPNPVLSRTAIQMLHKTTPTRRRVRTLRHSQPCLLLPARWVDDVAALRSPWRRCSRHNHAHFLPASPAPSPPARGSSVCSLERAVVITRAALAQNCLVTIAEKPPPQPMPAIMPPSISVLQPSHSPHQVGFGRFHHQMIVIAHQHPCMHPPARPLTRLSQCLVK